MFVECPGRLVTLTSDSSVSVSPSWTAVAKADRPAPVRKAGHSDTLQRAAYPGGLNHDRSRDAAATRYTPPPTPPPPASTPGDTGLSEPKFTSMLAVTDGCVPVAGLEFPLPHGLDGLFIQTTPGCAAPGCSWPAAGVDFDIQQHRSRVLGLRASSCTPVSLVEQDRSLTPAPTWYAAPGTAAAAGVAWDGIRQAERDAHLRELPPRSSSVPLQYGLQRGVAQLIRPAHTCASLTLPLASSFTSTTTVPARSA